MNVVQIYVSAAQLVLQTSDSVATSPDSQRLVDLNRLLPHLRQLLSCSVCCRLLIDPYGPHSARCHHNVCRLCVRGRKSLRPHCSACKDCQDFKTYDENRQMRCLLLCYKSLCEHLMASNLFAQLSKQKPTQPNTVSALPIIPLPNMSTQEFILEGASYEDILSTFTVDLPRANAPRLQVPSNAFTIQTTTASSSTAAIPLPATATMHILAAANQSQTAPKAPTPPTTSTTVSAIPAPPLIKQEHTSTSLPRANATQTTQPQLLPSHISQSQSMTVKHWKNMVDLSAAVQVPLTSSSLAASSVSVPATSTITYVGPHSHSGVVVPMGTSTVTTSAPLTIASAKLQTLNRQLAQARNAITVSSASHSSDGHTPRTFKVSLAPSSIATASGTTTTTATITSQQIRNPPPIKTVSNGSAMYSVLYTGIGNKITIKRKTDGDEDTAAQRKNASTSAPPPAVFRQMSKPNPKRRGCRCGNATPTPGKLTCCGQRCPCYVDSKSCIGCKCRGCRNPHRPDGGKVRPVIPELACYEIQMADENSSLSPSELSIATTMQPTQSVATSNVAATATSSGESNPLQHQAIHQQHHQQQVQQFVEDYAVQQQPVSASQMSLTATASSSSNTATLIPFRNLQHIAATSSQQQQSQTLSAISGSQQQQQQHVQQQTHSTSNMLQLENLQHESVLIQNAEGKYQVVNVFTTGPSHNQNSNQMSGLQRLHTISQLQSTNTSSSSNATNNIMTTGSNTFILPNATASYSSSSCTTTNVTPNTTTHNTLPQIIMQHHHQQQQHHQQQSQQQQHTHVQRVSNTSMSMQLQQQLKQNNIITVHPIASHAPPSASSSSTQTMPIISPSTAPNTITLSPIIVSSPNCFPPDIFSDSSDEFVSLNNASAQMPRIVTTTVPAMQDSPLSLSGSGIGGGSSGIGHVDSIGTTHHHHLTPAMIEVIESNDVRLLQADGFPNY